MMRKTTLVIIAFLSVCCSLSAQVSVQSRIEDMELMIGQQTKLTVSATVNKDARVEFPSFQPQQMIVPGVEVLAQHDTDSSTVEDNMIKRIRVYTLTSFDGKLYYLPPVKVKVNGKTFTTNKLALKVVEVDVDTTNVDKFFPPKDVQDNPFLWSDWSTAFWLSILMLLLSAAAGWLYVQLRTGKPIVIPIKAIKRLLPHQKAMREIELIKEGHMTASENSKEYYTRLTETLRKYIEERYGFRAMEMTSSEIIERLTAAQDSKDIEELRELFETADLVKFAKYSTLINENDRNLISAIDFINATKTEAPAQEEPKPRLSEEDERQMKERKLLKVSIMAISLIAVGLLGVVIYLIYGNLA